MIIALQREALGKLETRRRWGYLTVVSASLGHPLAVELLLVAKHLDRGVVRAGDWHRWGPRQCRWGDAEIFLPNGRVTYDRVRMCQDAYGRWDAVTDEAAAADQQRRIDRLAYLRDSFDYDALDADARVSYRVFEYLQETGIRQAPAPITDTIDQLTDQPNRRTK